MTMMEIMDVFCRARNGGGRIPFAALVYLLVMIKKFNVLKGQRLIGNRKSGNGFDVVTSGF